MLTIISCATHHRVLSDAAAIYLPMRSSLTCPRYSASAAPGEMADPRNTDIAAPTPSSRATKARTAAHRATRSQNKKKVAASPCALVQQTSQVQLTCGAAWAVMFNERPCVVMSFLVRTGAAHTQEAGASMKRSALSQLGLWASSWTAVAAHSMAQPPASMLYRCDTCPGQASSFHYAQVWLASSSEQIADAFRQALAMGCAVAWLCQGVCLVLRRGAACKVATMLVASHDAPTAGTTQCGDGYFGFTQA